MTITQKRTAALTLAIPTIMPANQVSANDGKYRCKKVPSSTQVPAAITLTITKKPDTASQIKTLFMGCTAYAQTRRSSK